MNKLAVLLRIYWNFHKSQEALVKLFQALDRNDLVAAERYENLYVNHVNKANSYDWSKNLRIYER